jgi:hypothetical protein
VILVHLKRTWPLVQDGRLTEDDATLKAWAGVSDDALGSYGDVVAGIYDNTVVTVYDVASWSRQPDGRVIFAGKPSSQWAYLKGHPNPGRPWGRQGDTRPVQYLDSEAVASGSVPVHRSAHGKRAVIDDFALSVGDDGNAVLVIPPGRQVMIRTG